MTAKHVVSAKTGTSRDVDLTPQQEADFRASQSTPAQAAQRQAAAAKQRAFEVAREVYLAEQMAQRAQDPGAPQELKDWAALP